MKVRGSNGETGRTCHSSAACLLLLTALFSSIPTWCAGQTAREASVSPGRDQESGTAVLPWAYEVWRSDGAREARKEAVYWATLREREVARLRKLYYAETEQALQRARARGEAYSRIASAKRATEQAEGAPVTRSHVTHSAGQQMDAARDTIAKAAAAATQKVQGVGGTVNRAAQRLAEAIEDSFLPEASGQKPGTSAVALALLAIFLLPGLAAMLLFLAFRSFRAGYRLRGTAFAASGLTLAALIYAAAFSRESIPDWDRLRAECRAQAINISANLHEVNGDGAVLVEIRSLSGQTAATDRNGFAFLFTEEPEELTNGKTLQRTVYPVGSKKMHDALGLGNEMPAYTDSLERALTYRAQEDNGKSFWQILSRTLRKG